ncbi:MAG: hypothetical protein NVS4B12_05030 [Ktedonobacteraceae bacterium]
MLVITHRVILHIFTTFNEGLSGMKRTGSSIKLLSYIAIVLMTVVSCVFLGKEYVFQALFPLKAHSAVTHSLSSEFVMHSGSQLQLNGQPFRFAGANIHWLGLDDSTNYPSQFRVDDALESAQDMGATVVRVHSLGISTGCSNCIEPSLGVFNENALRHNDYVIKTAREHGIRLIIPLTDNWHYPAGGKHSFTDWRGIPDEEQFYFNTQVIKDFEDFIKTLLTHVNTYTGIAYKDDPTILAWETGNELDPPTIWTKLISTYIKSVDSNHLVMDGKTGVDPQAASLSDVDIVSNHYYPMNISALIHDAEAARQAGKVFCVGEFDWNNANGGDALNSFLAAVASNTTVVGDLFWELWSHNDEYGYVSNQVKYTLHYPGDSAAMRMSVHELRMHAYNMSGMPVPAERRPGPPLIDVVIRGEHDNVLLWRGTAGAASYTIERSATGADGPWAVICDRCATDMSTPWTDTAAPRGVLWYRVTGYNVSGVAGTPSVPYQASSAQMIFDDLNDWSKTYQHSSNLAFDTTNPQYMHGDSTRVDRTAATHESITWRQVGMRSFQAIAYFWPSEPVSHFSLYTSTDGRSWTLAKPIINNIDGNWAQYVYTLNGLSDVNYVKLVWNNTSGQIWNPTLGDVTITF